MAHVNTYRTNVRIGNWNEELRLEEEEKYEYLMKKQRGELAAQKVEVLKENILRPVDLTATSDGGLHFGDVVMLVNPGGGDRKRSAVSINADIHSLTRTAPLGIAAPCEVSAGPCVAACARNAFIITSVDGSAEGSLLHFEQSFALRTTSGFASGLYLTSDLKSFQKCAKKSHLQEVNLVENVSFLSWWKIVYIDPRERLEYEGQPVPADVNAVIVHCKTNHALSALGDQVLWTTFGKEYEVTAHTFYDSHKVEQDKNHWVVCTFHPTGDGLEPLNQPRSAADNTELTEETPCI